MQNAKSRKKGIARLLELSMRKKLLVISSLVLAVISAALSFAPFIAVYCIIRELVAHYSDLSGLNKAYLAQLGWFAAGSSAAAVLMNFAALMCSHFAAFETLYSLKLDFTRHIASLPLGFHNRNSTGALRKIVDVNIEKLESFIAHQLPDLAGSIAMPACTLIILFVFDWRLGVASLIPLIIAYVIQIAAFSQEKAKTFIGKYQNALEDMNNAAVEYVRGISVVKAFNQTVLSFGKFRETIKLYGQYVIGYTLEFKNFYSLFALIISHVYLFLIPAIIFLSGGAGDYAHFALSCVFYLIFSMSIPAAFMKVMYTSTICGQVADGIERMDKILDEVPLVETASPKTANGYTVKFENVRFTYNAEAEAVAINNVSFTANQGEITALVGPSGGGKSTLANLIPRFYDVTDGAVKIGGTDIRDMSSEYLMSIVSFVFQDVFLFKQSVMENLLIGSKNAAKEQVIAASTAAMCHDFITALPKGYDTVIGGNGIHLSGGERQRIAIARAILKDAPILVLDEATAFADPENEQKIQTALSSLMKDKTVVIIAHRLSTVRNADKIIVIDKGRVAETGRHEQLVVAGGRYSRMWSQYSGAASWSVTGTGKENCNV